MNNLLLFLEIILLFHNEFIFSAKVNFKNDRVWSWNKENRIAIVVPTFRGQIEFWELITSFCQFGIGMSFITILL